MEGPRAPGGSRGGLSPVELLVLGMVEACGGLMVTHVPRLEVRTWNGWLSPEAAYEF